MQGNYDQFVGVVGEQFPQMRQGSELRVPSTLMQGSEGMMHAVNMGSASTYGQFPPSGVMGSQGGMAHHQGSYDLRMQALDQRNVLPNQVGAETAFAQNDMRQQIMGVQGGGFDQTGGQLSGVTYQAMPVDSGYANNSYYAVPVQNVFSNSSLGVPGDMMQVVNQQMPYQQTVGLRKERPTTVSSFGGGRQSAQPRINDSSRSTRKSPLPRRLPLENEPIAQFGKVPEAQLSKTTSAPKGAAEGQRGSKQSSGLPAQAVQPMVLTNTSPTFLSNAAGNVAANMAAFQPRAIPITQTNVVRQVSTASARGAWESTPTGTQSLFHLNKLQEKFQQQLKHTQRLVTVANAQRLVTVEQELSKTGAQEKKSEKETTDGQDKGTYTCKVCNVKATCRFNLLEHMNGKRHAARLAELGLAKSSKVGGANGNSQHKEDPEKHPKVEQKKDPKKVDPKKDQTKDQNQKEGKKNEKKDEGKKKDQKKATEVQAAGGKSQGKLAKDSGDNHRWFSRIAVGADLGFDEKGKTIRYMDQSVSTDLRNAAIEFLELTVVKDLKIAKAEESAYIFGSQDDVEDEIFQVLEGDPSPCCIMLASDMLTEYKSLLHKLVKVARQKEIRVIYSLSRFKLSTMRWNTTCIDKDGTRRAGDGKSIGVVFVFGFSAAEEQYHIMSALAHCGTEEWEEAHRTQHVAEVAGRQAGELGDEGISGHDGKAGDQDGDTSGQVGGDGSMDEPAPGESQAEGCPDQEAPQAPDRETERSDEAAGHQTGEEAVGDVETDTAHESHDPETQAGEEAIGQAMVDSTEEVLAMVDSTEEVLMVSEADLMCEAEVAQDENNETMPATSAIEVLGEDTPILIENILDGVSEQLDDMEDT
ncbi:hypothetical protein CYMTET_38068 [Cymbomonas tetramitiformis]|uniref:U1-type domain-containing protein n=1 Tax=Cymbomonas tetramitiformis TaxID=36881 RepID=A0AAE0CET9_9CHLO|nr:hypothetical protein CYMTET_38068 [Cymbomonas tetramitiformis]